MTPNYLIPKAEKDPYLLIAVFYLAQIITTRGQKGFLGSEGQLLVERANDRQERMGRDDALRLDNLRKRSRDQTALTLLTLSTGSNAIGASS